MSLKKKKEAGRFQKRTKIKRRIIATLFHILMRLYMDEDGGGNTSLQRREKGVRGFEKLER